MDAPAAAEEAAKTDLENWRGGRDSNPELDRNRVAYLVPGKVREGACRLEGPWPRQGMTRRATTFRLGL